LPKDVATKRLKFSGICKKKPVSKLRLRESCKGIRE
jgi:hypothetical protein